MLLAGNRDRPPDGRGRAFTHTGFSLFPPSASRATLLPHSLRAVPATASEGADPTVQNDAFEVIPMGERTLRPPIIATLAAHMPRPRPLRPCTMAPVGLATLAAVPMYQGECFGSVTAAVNSHPARIPAVASK